MRLILNEELPRDLRRALQRDARERDLTLNDTAVRVLAERMKMKWERARARYTRIGPRFKLRVSDEMHRTIKIEAATQGHTVRGVVLQHLSSHYETRPIDPHRRRRVKR